MPVVLFAKSTSVTTASWDGTICLRPGSGYMHPVSRRGALAIPFHWRRGGGRDSISAFRIGRFPPAAGLVADAEAVGAARPG